MLVTQENGAFRQEFRTKDEPVEFGKDRAGGQEPSQVKVHQQGGNMEYESTYAEDRLRARVNR